MATLNSKKNRQSYLLSVTPINYSLTDGTNIPPPPESPRKQSPPAFRGGPLSSHPATPPNGAMKHGDAHDSPIADEERTESFRSPTSDGSNANYYSSPQDRRKPGGVRRLFSLSNLRSSFSSSRTSLSQPRQSQDTLGGHQQQLHQPNGAYRASSPSMASTTAPSSRAPSAAPPQLRQSKSGGNWFKRKSSMFLNGELEAVAENQRPETRESKRLREEKPAPLLPEIDSLSGGKTRGGDLGWDEKVFKK